MPKMQIRRQPTGDLDIGLVAEVGIVLEIPVQKALERLPRGPGPAGERRGTHAVINRQAGQTAASEQLIEIRGGPTLGNRRRQFG